MLKYKKIANQLLWKIKAGVYSVSGNLPSERDLAKHFYVSQKTINNAMVLLKKKGVLETRHGSGNYVLSANPGRNRGEIAIIMNCSPSRQMEDFLSQDFLGLLGKIDFCSLFEGVATNLLIYDESAKQYENNIIKKCEAEYFLNLFFTIPPLLAKQIVADGKTVLSTLHSFQESYFLEHYGNLPYVMNDCSPGIAEAFHYYKNIGINNFAFFAQGEWGKNNYKIFSSIAEKERVQLSEHYYALKKENEKSVFSMRRINFFRQVLNKLPEGTVVFSDGIFHIAELCQSLISDHLLSRCRFCVTGVSNPDLFAMIPVEIGWIRNKPEACVFSASEILLQAILSGKPITGKHCIPSDFEILANTGKN